MAEGKSTRLNEHQRSRNRPPKSKKKVSLPSCSRSGLQRLRMLAFFFFYIYLCAHFRSWVKVLRTFFLTFRHVGGSQKRVHSVHLVHRRLKRSICLQSWPKAKIGEEMTGSQWRSSPWSEESWPEVCAPDDSIFCDGSWEVLVRMRHEDVHFEKKSFWRTAEERRVLPVKEIHLQKSCLQNFLHQNDSKRLYIVSLHCWRWYA